MTKYENNSELQNRVIRLHRLFLEGKIPQLHQHEVNPGHPKDSRENYLYFTLPPCLNFQRSSSAMWASALKTHEDPETRYLFYPEEVVKKSRAIIQSDLTKHKLSLQKNKHTNIWMTISQTFYGYFDSDPRKLLEVDNWDVVKIKQRLQKDMKKQFPYISGPKMANYWLYILSQYTDAQFSNRQEITIIPDTHVKQCSIKLGIATEKSTPEQIALLWTALLKDTELLPVDMHPVLWNWSRNKFIPEI